MYYTKFVTRFCDIILAGDEDGLTHLHLNTGEGSRRFDIISKWKSNPVFFAKTRSQIIEFIDGTRHSFDIQINPQGTKF